MGMLGGNESLAVALPIVVQRGENMPQYFSSGGIFGRGHGALMRDTFAASSKAISCTEWSGGQLIR